MVDYPAISGVDDASQTRVALVQGKQIVHVPLLGLPIQPLDADLTSWAAITRAAGFDTFVATPSSANMAALVTGETGTGALVFGTSPTIDTPRLTLEQSANPGPVTEGIIQWDTDQDRIVVGDGAGQAIFGQVTPWVAYTPTFTGFGTPSGVSIFSTRHGDSLLLMGKFTGGTSTAVEARMTLGFNGTNANVTSDATKVASIRFAGLGVISAATTPMSAVLIESAVGYVTFGFQGTSNAGLTKLLGNAFLSSGVTFAFTAIVPISGW